MHVRGFGLWSLNGRRVPFLQDLKNHFRMRIRVICERLIRKMGYEFVESLVPEEHKKLLVNIKCVLGGIGEG